MKIAIIGTGTVAKALATGYTRHGHEVRIGTRDPSRAELQDWDPASSPEVAADAEIIVLAVVGNAAVEVMTSIAAQAAGKVVIDTTNPHLHIDGEVRLFTPADDSLGEQVQRAAGDAHVVKAYNIVGSPLMIDPDLPGGPPTMFIAGNDGGAKATVAALLADTGWEAADLGGIDNSRATELLSLTWVRYGLATGTWDHAFKMLHR
jgi:8-hydroxy-5-deazaflavin:NADPH oxidoreductase